MLPRILIMAAPVLGQATASDTAAAFWTPSAVSAASAPSDAAAPVLPPVMPPGSACPADSNGEWNCLSNCWQRCAAGFWSGTMAMAPGTQCIPLGLSFDLQIVHAGAPTTYTTSTANSTLSTSSLSDATCACSTTSCTVLPPSSSSSLSPSASPSSTTTDETGFKNGHPSGGSSFGVGTAVVLGFAVVGGFVLL